MAALAVQLVLAVEVGEFLAAGVVHARQGHMALVHRGVAVHAGAQGGQVLAVGHRILGVHFGGVGAGILGDGAHDDVQGRVQAVLRHVVLDAGQAAQEHDDRVQVLLGHAGVVLVGHEGEQGLAVLAHARAQHPHQLAVAVSPQVVGGQVLGRQVAGQADGRGEQGLAALELGAGDHRVAVGVEVAVAMAAHAAGHALG